MTTQILITIYLMIGSYLVGKEDYRSHNPLWFDISTSILVIFILPILYLLDFIKYILIEFYNYIGFISWYNYFFRWEKTYSKWLKQTTDEALINILKKTKPKHKLDALLRKKLLKRINHEKRIR